MLKIIKSHHIERLLQKFDIGKQILFEHNLEEWRNSIGVPMVYPPDSTLSSPSTSRASTPSSREYRYVPYVTPPSPTEQSGDSQISLSSILNDTPKGIMLVEYYKKFSKFQDDQRTSLINLVAQCFEEKNVALTLAASYRLEREILERFPEEKLVIF